MERCHLLDKSHGNSLTERLKYEMYENTNKQIKNKMTNDKTIFIYIMEQHEQ